MGLALTLVHPYGHFCSFQLCFFDHFACVKADCKKLGTGVYFYWNFTVIFFKKKYFFALGTKNTPSQHFLDKNVSIETH